MQPANNVVIFNSSEDEFVAIGDSWRNTLYDSQEGAVARIATALLDRPDIRLRLPAHLAAGQLD